MNRLGLINTMKALTGNEDPSVFLAMYASFIAIWLVIIPVMGSKRKWREDLWRGAEAAAVRKEQETSSANL